MPKIMTEDNRNTPTTVRELGIEFQGFRSLVDVKFQSLTESIERLANALENSNSNKADRKDLDDLIVRIVALELAQNKKPWAIMILSGAFMTVFTAVILYVVNDLINGGK